MQYLYIVRGNVLILGIIRRGLEWSPEIWLWQFSSSGYYRSPSLQRRIATSVRIRGRRLTSPKDTGHNPILIPACIRTATTAIIPASNAGITLTITTILAGNADTSTATTTHSSIRPTVIEKGFFNLIIFNINHIL